MSLFPKKWSVPLNLSCMLKLCVLNAKACELKLVMFFFILHLTVKGKLSDYN